jgi:hypothetical protein
LARRGVKLAGSAKSSIRAYRVVAPALSWRRLRVWNSGEADLSMSGKFVALGVPRSGTTLLGKTLNAHPEIVCGWERFHHRTLSPEHLTPEGFLTMDLDRAKVDYTAALIEEKKHRPNLTFGDKIPRAYLSLDHFLPRFEQAGEPLKLIAIVRNVDDSAHSWRRRAADEKDGGWERGMFGVFPYLEFYLMFRRLADLADRAETLMISYSAFTDQKRRADTLAAIARHLGVAEDNSMADYMVSEDRITQNAHDRERSAEPDDFRSEDQFFRAALRIVERHGPCLYSDVKAELDEKIDLFSKRVRFRNEVTEYVEASQSPDMRAYGAKMVRTYLNMLDDRDIRLKRGLAKVFSADGAEA